MRPTTRLLAQVAARTSNYLNTTAPTGLTGLLTHPCPRPTLILLYNQTLDKLKQLPETSVYRKSTEALTLARLKIVEAQVPAGLDAYRERAAKHIAQHPQVFSKRGRAAEVTAGGQKFVVRKHRKVLDERVAEWDQEEQSDVELGEGPRSAREARQQGAELGVDVAMDDFDNVDVELEQEPPLTAQQITDIETQISAGLIEEIVVVAEGELKLADEMLQAKVWEELEEKPVEGQWTYFSRDAHAAGTQAP